MNLRVSWIHFCCAKVPLTWPNWPKARFMEPLAKPSSAGEVFPPQVDTIDIPQDFDLFPLHENSADIYYFSEPNAGQIQEGIGEAVNNIVKHFHKPEKEV